MPICAYGKSKKVKVGPTVEETQCQNCRSQSQQPWGTDVGQVSKTVLDLCLAF
jgi:hypothetical protein